MPDPFDALVVANLIGNQSIFRAGPSGPHGTATYLSATTLTLALDPGGGAFDPYNFEILAVIEHEPVNRTIEVYYNKGGGGGPSVVNTSLFQYDTATNILTVPGATFGAANQFTVLYMNMSEANSEPSSTELLELLVGLPGIYSSPTDFTAAWASATTLTLTGIPFSPNNEQFLAVIEIAAGGAKTVYTSRAGETFSFAAATGVLTVAGATFTNTSAFVVIIAGQIKGFDAITNAMQSAELTARQQDWVDSSSVITAHDLAVSSPADSGWINVKGETHMRLFYDWTSGAGAGIHNLIVTMFGNDTDAGTTEYEDKVALATLGTSVNGAAQNVEDSELVEVTGYDRVKVYIDESGGTGKGTITLTVTQMNR